MNTVSQWADTLAMMSLRRGEWNFLTHNSVHYQEALSEWKYASFPEQGNPLHGFLCLHDGDGKMIMNMLAWGWGLGDPLHDLVTPTLFLLALMDISVVWVLGSAWASKDSASNLVYTSILYAFLLKPFPWTFIFRNVGFWQRKVNILWPQHQWQRQEF